MGLDKAITHFRCHPEDEWIRAQCEIQEQEFVAEQIAADRLDRLNGPCDVCGTSDHYGLVISGNEAQCDDCFAALAVRHGL